MENLNLETIEQKVLGKSSASDIKCPLCFYCGIVIESVHLPLAIIHKTLKRTKSGTLKRIKDISSICYEITQYINEEFKNANSKSYRTGRYVTDAGFLVSAYLIYF